MNIIEFDLNLLRVFDAMMAERNVTRAGTGVPSQPAVTTRRRDSERNRDPLFVASRAAK